MKHAFYLAVRYLRSAPGRTAVLVFGLTVAFFLPIFTGLAAGRLETALLARAESSPILLGRAGDEFELTLASLYFRTGAQAGDLPTVPFGLVAAVEDPGYGLALPLHVGHSTGGATVVGTVPEYFDSRGLKAAEGRLPLLIGEIVAGSEIARRFRLEVGDRLRSDLSNLYNLAGAYPLLLEVVGILEPSRGPDDGVFFGSIETSWALDGLFHGHEEITEANALGVPGEAGENDPSKVPGTSSGTSSSASTGSDPVAEETENLEASAALFLFAEIDDRNRASFHLHGDPNEAPSTAILVLPKDRRAHDQLLGDFALHDLYQAVRPVDVVRTLLDLVLRLRRGLEAYFGVVAVSTLAFVGLVLVLSARLRRDELRLMVRLGANRATVVGLLGAEVALVVVLALAASCLFSWAGLAVLDAFLLGG